MPGPKPRGMKSSVENPGKILGRLMKYVFRNYAPHVITTIICILISVICNAR